MDEIDSKAYEEVCRTLVGWQGGFRDRDIETVADEIFAAIASSSAGQEAKDAAPIPAQQAVAVKERNRIGDIETVSAILREHGVGYADADIAATAIVDRLPSMFAALVPAPQPVGEVRESQAEIDVLAERRRQVEAEGWTPEHDDTHAKGEMLTAAWCYIQRHADKDMFGPSYDINSLPAPARWPWDLSWWKPTNRRRDLVKAGALILAEIERLDRAAPSSQAQEDGR